MSKIQSNQSKIIEFEDNVSTWIYESTHSMWEVKNSNNIRWVKSRTFSGGLGHWSCDGSGQTVFFWMEDGEGTLLTHSGSRRPRIRRKLRFFHCYLKTESKPHANLRSKWTISLKIWRREQGNLTIVTASWYPVTWNPSSRFLFTTHFIRCGTHTRHLSWLKMSRSKTLRCWRDWSGESGRLKTTSDRPTSRRQATEK